MSKTTTTPNKKRQYEPAPPHGLRRAVIIVMGLLILMYLREIHSNVMTLFPLLYGLLILFSMGYKRKPWFYGLPDTHPVLKKKLFRVLLIMIFSVHTVTALFYATTWYEAFFKAA